MRMLLADEGASVWAAAAAAAAAAAGYSDACTCVTARAVGLTTLSRDVVEHILHLLLVLLLTALDAAAERVDLVNVVAEHTGSKPCSSR
jgi:hypothetical protein